MIGKCSSKLIGQIIELIILVVLAVQANGLINHPSLCTSSRPIRLLHPSQTLIGDAEESLYDCLETGVEHCKTTHSHEGLMFKECITYSLFFRVLAFSPKAN
jgi:hypothetical protein